MIPYRLIALRLLCPALFLAEPAVRLSAGAGQALDPGETVVVRFSGIPADVDEFELLLVAGANRPFRLRISKDMPADTPSFLWTVPNLDLADARLVLRMGRRGRETEGARSDPFSIAGSPYEASTRLEVRFGEVWIDPDSERRDETPSLPDADLGGTSPSFERRADRLDFVEEPSATALFEASPHSGLRLGRSAPPERIVAVLSLSRIPLSIPARI